MEEKQKTPLERAQMLAPKKPPLRTRVCFYLTCWRPVSKYELSKVVQAFLSIDTRIRMTIDQLNKLTIMFNQMVAYQEGYNEGHQQPKQQVQQSKAVKEEKKEEDNPMYS